MCVEELTHNYISHTVVLYIAVLGELTCHSLCRKLYIFSDVQNGTTPLMVASLKEHVEVVRVLIGSRAQLNTQDEV